MNAAVMYIQVSQPHSSHDNKQCQVSIREQHIMDIVCDSTNKRQLATLGQFLLNTATSTAHRGDAS